MLGALRLIQGFTPALAEAKGSVVNVNSMVVRHSDPKQGAYKMAKSALLAMSQSLASELGTQGIRVNSVLPGYIWGGTLQGYFEHQAGKYGTTVDEIYKAAAVNSDLKRLPTEDEVASAILFMASDLSSGITGQALDVNCGEYQGTDRARPSEDQIPDVVHRRRPARLGRRRPAASTTSASTTTTTARRSACCSSRFAATPTSPSSAARCSGSSSATHWWPDWCPRRRSSSIRSTPTSSIERPIFVTGLPRTGTTAIHRLLTADPRHQGLELWLAEFPQPRPPRETWSQNPVFQQIDAQFAKAHEENPDYTGLHYMTADEVEECWQLLRQSLHSVSYETLAHLPTYSQWLAEQDWTKPYRRHRKNLQLIGLNDAEKRWVLKNPSHLFALDALFADLPRCAGGAVPPAGRDDHGVDVLAGPAHHRGMVEQLHRRGDRRGLMETWSRGLELFNSERAKHDPAQFYDLDYFELIKDPIARRGGHVRAVRHRVHRRRPRRHDGDRTPRARRARARPSTPTRWRTTG